MRWGVLWGRLLVVGLFGLLLSACHHQPKVAKPKKPHHHKKIFIKKSYAQRQREEAAKIRQELEKFKLIYIYTPVLRFYDYGTIGRTKEGDLELVLYKLSHRFGDIIIKKNYICFSGTCMAKWSAARDMFGKVSYGNLFDDIVLGRDIFHGLGKQIAPNGTLIQRFVENGQLIYYERTFGKTLFQNMTTGVAIVFEAYHPQ
ncbi:putative [Helicobacter heilmannii]|uniref:Putative n=1 Tax=Helicobacter heilmannii TaxID=35817 RepID=A0A0K2YAD3_HELHE|nr:putative [Helicobacter heilmannii]